MGYGIMVGILSSIVAYAVWEGLIGGILQLVMIGGLCVAWYGAGILNAVNECN